MGIRLLVDVAKNYFVYFEVEIIFFIIKFEQSLSKAVVVRNFIELEARNLYPHFLKFPGKVS